MATEKVGRLVSVVALVAALLAAVAAGVRANMANPVAPGDVIGEPSGELSAITIERERLTLDLRRLADGGSARVEASYQVRNDGGQKALRLLFVATSLDGQQSSVALDGQQVPVEPSTGENTVWTPPSTTPSFDGRQLPYSAVTRGQLAFSLTLTPGPHRIDVSYTATPTRYSGDSPTVYWQLGYVLAPARQWAGFGALDVAVLVPAGWRAATEPAFSRDGDELRGSFTALPADTLGVTVQMPPPASGGQWAPLVLLGLLIGAGLVGWLFGRSVGARGRSVGWIVALAVVYGVGALLGSVLAAGLAEASRTAGVPSSQIAWTYGYGSEIAFVVLAPFVAVTAALLVLVVGWLAARRARPT